MFFRSALVLGGAILWGMTPASAAPQKITVLWSGAAPSGEVTVLRGTLDALTAVGGDTPTAGSFRFPAQAAGQLTLTVTSTAHEPLPALVTVRNSRFVRATSTRGIRSICRTTA
jgi:hypothetical protein